MVAEEVEKAEVRGDDREWALVVRGGGGPEVPTACWVSGCRSRAGVREYGWKMIGYWVVSNHYIMNNLVKKLLLLLLFFLLLLLWCLWNGKGWQVRSLYTIVQRILPTHSHHLTVDLQ